MPLLEIMIAVAGNDKLDHIGSESAQGPDLQRLVALFGSGKTQPEDYQDYCRSVERYFGDAVVYLLF